MWVLSSENKVVDTDLYRVPGDVQEDMNPVSYSVLSFNDYRNPDFFFDRKLDQIYICDGPLISMTIGSHILRMPLRWSIMIVQDTEVELMPLIEILGWRQFKAFCVNPIDGYIPEFLELRTGTLHVDTSWTCPIIKDKDMLVVPLEFQRVMETGVPKGPVCAIFSRTRVDLHRSISDIW